MNSTPFEATPVEAEPTQQSADSDSFQASMQTIVNVIFIILGIPGNMLAILFVWKKSDRSLRPIMPFLLNLAAADVLVLTVYIPFYIAYEATDFEWPFGTFLCKTVFSLTHVCMYASLGTLTAIAVERYLKVFCDGVKRKTSTVKYVIVIIWVFAISLSIPQLVYLKTVKIDDFFEDFEEEEFSQGEGMDQRDPKYVCVIEWPHPNLETILQPIDTVILYLMPLSFVFIIYAKIINKLRAIDQKQLPPARLVFVKQRQCAIRKMVAIIVIFALCHLPIHVFHLLRVFFFESWLVLETEYPWVFSLSVNLVLVTHVVNPLVYGSLHHCFAFGVQFLDYMDCRCRFKPAKDFSLVIRKSNTQQTQ
ncbi:neuropeptide Y receptor type 6-like [Oculina patagonica]